MEPWLKRLLIQTGRMTESGVTRKAKIRTHTCGIPCLAGLDDEICASEAWCELQPINTIGEAEALLEGRTTYNYWPSMDKFYRRTLDHIRHSSSGTETRTVQLVEHRCQQPFPAHWADTRNDQPEATAREETDECPF